MTGRFYKLVLDFARKKKYLKLAKENEYFKVGRCDFEPILGAGNTTVDEFVDYAERPKIVFCIIDVDSVVPLDKPLEASQNFVKLMRS